MKLTSRHYRAPLILNALAPQVTNDEDAHKLLTKVSIVGGVYTDLATSLALDLTGKCKKSPSYRHAFKRAVTQLTREVKSTDRAYYMKHGTSRSLEAFDEITDRWLATFKKDLFIFTLTIKRRYQAENTPEADLHAHIDATGYVIGIIDYALNVMLRAVGQAIGKKIDNHAPLDRVICALGITKQALGAKVIRIEELRKGDAQFDQAAAIIFNRVADIDRLIEINNQVIDEYETN